MTSTSTHRRPDSAGGRDRSRRPGWGRGTTLRSRNTSAPEALPNHEFVAGGREVPSVRTTSQACPEKAASKASAPQSNRCYLPTLSPPPFRTCTRRREGGGFVGQLDWCVGADHVCAGQSLVE